MDQDSKYHLKKPASFARLFLEGRGLIGCMLAVIAVALHLALGWDAYQVERFNTHAEKATAKVSRIVGDEALVTYHTPQGSFAGRISRWGLEQGETVTVYYTPDAPAEIRRRLRDHLPLTGWFQAFGTGLGLIALWLIWQRGMFTIRALQTRRYGLLIPATVTRIEEIRSKQLGGDPIAILHCQLDDGTFVRSLWHQPRQLRHWRSGDATEVYIYKDRMFWRGDLGPRPMRQTRMPQVSRSGHRASDS